jgi:hypothetical protein
MLGSAGSSTQQQHLLILALSKTVRVGAALWWVGAASGAWRVLFPVDLPE